MFLAFSPLQKWIKGKAKRVAALQIINRETFSRKAQDKIFLRREQGFWKVGYLGTLQQLPWTMFDSIESGNELILNRDCITARGQMS